MSVASSAASTRSVSYQGEELTVEQMIDLIIREVQSALNGLQQALRNLCALEDQQVDPEDDYKEAVALADATEDISETITAILKDLVPVVADLRGPPPSKEARAWFAAHKAERKAELARAKAERKAEAAAAKEAAKKEGAKGLPDVAE